MLESEAHATQRGASVRYVLESMRISYRGLDLIESMPEQKEWANGVPLENELGPASLMYALSNALTAELANVTHVLTGRDGVEAESDWVTR